MAVQGMRVMPGEKLFDIVDLSSVWIVADIYEYELPLIKVGQTARIGLSYFPGKEFSSRVDYIYPSLASETRTAKVRFTIPNPDGALKPQMFTNVEIKINLGNRLAVPSEAVIDTGVRQIVYVDKGEGYFEPREVTTGLKVDELVEVTAGIKMIMPSNSPADREEFNCFLTPSATCPTVTSWAAVATSRGWLPPAETCAPNSVLSRVFTLYNSLEEARYIGVEW